MEIVPRFFAVYAIILLLLHQAAPTPAPDGTEIARRQIESLYTKRAQGLMNGDIRSVLDILAPGFSQRYVQGQILTRKAWEEGLRSRFDEIKAQAQQAKGLGAQWKNPERVFTVIEKVTVQGDRARISEVTTTTTSAAYPQGVSYGAKMEETSDDTWVKTALGWRLLIIEQIRNKTTTDEMRTKPGVKPAAKQP